MRASQTVTLSWFFTKNGCSSTTVVISWCPLDGGICKQIVGVVGKLSYKWQASLDAIPGGNFRLSYYNHDDNCGIVKYAYSKNFTTNFCSTFSILSSPKEAWVQQVGDPAEFSVNATGTELTYQWLHSDEPVPGATEWKYRMAAVTREDLGYYSVKITDKCGTTRTTGKAMLASCAELKVKKFKPFIQATVGKPLTLLIDVAYKGTLKFAWYKGNSTTILSDMSYLYFSGLTAQDYGQYTVKIDYLCPAGLASRTVLISDKPFVISENPPSTVYMFVGDTSDLSVGVLST